MARQLSSFFLPATARVTFFGACATGVALMTLAQAQTTPGPATPPGAPAPAAPGASATPPATPEEHPPKAPKLAKAVESPAFDNVRKALDALTPAQRKRFQENFMRWSNLSPEEKKALRDREELRKTLVAQEVDLALKDSGLELDPEHREQFTKRYGEERRKIEEQLRKEAAEKRKPLVREMIARLRQEFSTPAPLPATAQPNQ
jgi:Protein of unknown function (DUF3106)